MCPQTHPGVPTNPPRCAHKPTPVCPQAHPGVPAYPPRCAHQPTQVCPHTQPGFAKSDLGFTKTDLGFGKSEVGAPMIQGPIVFAPLHPKSVVIRSGTRHRSAPASRAPSGARRLVELSDFAGSGGCTTGCFLSSLRLGIGRGHGRFPTRPGAAHTALA
jgi:hypothetical protein